MRVTKAQSWKTCGCGRDKREGPESSGAGARLETSQCGAAGVGSHQPGLRKEAGAPETEAGASELKAAAPRFPSGQPPRAPRRAGSAPEAAEPPLPCEVGFGAGGRARWAVEVRRREPRGPP